ncbi:hypothetical protein SBF1_2550019 [Candidatus Desulfosporosinus infrequens]|uniref:Uncharacterized protein n=1 Tax=Candidatus Desulfosporosinus infrequens TaxID=2043169 RepID=A0A2U3KPI5_9FIRM|nr:hypothetical protein SBF1_2550019 [Candidatus Desulfosporosinus infrequens]
MNKYKMCWLRKFSHQHILYFHLSPRDQKGYLYTNIIEGYHRQVRKVTKTKTAYPTDDALRNGQCRSVNGKVAYIGLLWFEVGNISAHGLGRDLLPLHSYCEAESLCCRIYCLYHSRFTLAQWPVFHIEKVLNGSYETKVLKF